MYTLLLMIFSQDLKVPAEIRGEPNQFITILAETTGEIVRFVPLDPGLSVFPAELLSNKKATVVTGPAGKYRILAYTAIGNKPSDPAVCNVIIGNTPNPGPLPPNPAPIPPTPKPLSDLAASLAGIYGGLQEPGREDSVKILAQIYRQGAADLSRCSTLADCYNGLRAQSAVKLSPMAIIAIRQAIATDMKSRFGDVGEAGLTDSFKASLKQYFTDLAAVLEGLI